jgi:hypothetical protein
VSGERIGTVFAHPATWGKLIHAREAGYAPIVSSQAFDMSPPVPMGPISVGVTGARVPSSDERRLSEARQDQYAPSRRVSHAQRRIRLLRHLLVQRQE